MLPNSHSFLARLIARINPHLWEWIHPHVPDVAGKLGDASKFGPHSDPWLLQAVVAVADAHIAEIVALSRAAETVDGGAAKTIVDVAQRLVADYEELCPRWPKLPPWPPKRGPEPPPWWWREGAKLSVEEAFLAGARLTHAADVVSNKGLAESMRSVGARLMDRGLKG